jgi:hypothetical protein
MLPYRNRSEKGNALVEFAIVTVILIPLLFGAVAFGVNLGNWLQATQISRDIAHMYSRGIDFSAAANKDLAVNLVQGLGGMTVNGGNGVVILSQIRQVYQGDCDAANLSSNCPNLGKRVFTNRIVIGASSLRDSNFGTPDAAYVTSKGNIGSADYLQQSGLVVSDFDDSILPQAFGDVAFVVETFFATPDLNFLSGFAANATGGTYTRAIF